MKYVRLCINIILIPMYTVVGAAILFALFPFFRRRKYIDFLMRLWIRLILVTSGVKVTVEGQENIKEGKLYVFVANHQSLLDIPACFVAIPARLRMLAKKELFRIPVFGWGMWVVGHILIDREKSEKALASVDRAVERLKTEDISPVVYPEGTRSIDGKIHRFKKGAFVLALKAQRDIVPVTIIGSNLVMPKKSLFIKPGRIHVIIDTPISISGWSMENRSELAKQCQEVIENNFYKNADVPDNVPGEGKNTTEQ
ncbi:lysophospholipid acyltransferase family protein [candidate division KSB1 bacterium]